MATKTAELAPAQIKKKLEELEKRLILREMDEDTHAGRQLKDYIKELLASTNGEELAKQLDEERGDLYDSVRALVEKELDGANFASADDAMSANEVQDMISDELADTPDADKVREIVQEELENTPDEDRVREIVAEELGERVDDGIRAIVDDALSASDYLDSDDVREMIKEIAYVGDEVREEIKNYLQNNGFEDRAHTQRLIDSKLRELEARVSVTIASNMDAARAQASAQVDRLRAEIGARLAPDNTVVTRRIDELERSVIELEKALTEKPAAVPEPRVQLRSEAMAAGYRVAARQITNLAHAPLCAAVAAHTDAQFAREVLSSEVGRFGIAMLLSAGVDFFGSARAGHLPTYGNDVASQIARELRITATTDAGDAIMSALIGELGGAIKEALTGVLAAEKVRVDISGELGEAAELDLQFAQKERVHHG